MYALALANTGERFGYYTMLAIFTLFLQAKFGFSASVTSNIFAGFLALVYFLPVLGGYLADKFGYGKMVTSGIIVMFLGYVFPAVPTGNDAAGIAAMVGALVLIALGTGLFKGNLQVMVGNLYDDPKYAAKRDTAFSIFYMAINIGALFAPTAAEKITEGYTWARPASASQRRHSGPRTPVPRRQSDGRCAGQFTDLAAAQGAQWADNLGEFANRYIACLAGSYHWGFAVACVSLVISMMIYVFGRKTFKHADVNAKQVAASGSKEAAVELTPEQTKSRVTALMLVFAVVIFFWMAFHQNGLTLTFFARDYTATTATGLTRIGFDVINLVLIIIAVYGLFSFFQSEKGRTKLTSGAVTVASLALLAWKYSAMGDASDRHPAAEVPAVQSLLRRGADAGFDGRVRRAGQARQGSFGSAQDRYRHVHRGARLHHHGAGFVRPSHSERSGFGYDRLPRDAQPADRNLPRADVRRAVPVADGYLVRVEGRSSKYKGV